MATQNKFSSNLVAIAGLITAIAGLLTVLHQTGVIFNTDNTSNNENIEQTDQPATVIEDSKSASINNSSNSQEEMEAIKKQLEHTQTQLDQIKKVDSRETLPTSTVNEFNTNSTTLLTGTWQDVINYGKYIFRQDVSGNLTFQEHSVVEGSWIVTSEGNGVIENNTIELDYITLYGTAGRFSGKLQSDGSIRGIAIDNASGIQVQLHLKRQ